MELEGTDVAVLVLRLLRDTFLKLALLLETVLLRHLALLLVGLDDAAFGTELPHLAAKHGIFAELAFQTAVVDGDFDARLQTNLLEALLAVTQYPCLVTLEGMLEAFADHLICAEKVGGRDALAVGRVHHDDALLSRLGKVLEVLLRHGDVLRESSCAHVHGCRVHRLDVAVVGIDMVFELAFLRVVVVDAVEEILIEVGPFLEGKLLAEHAWRNVARNEGSLNGDGSRTAHGVDEVALAVPSRHENHAGSQHLV